MFLSRDDWDLGVAFQTHPGVRRHLEGKQRTSFSSRVATGISWSPLSGLKGVKPPVEFGESIRDCAPGHTGKEGPHLTMTGEPRGFSRVAAGFSSYDGDFRLPLVLGQGSPIIHSSCEVQAVFLLWSVGLMRLPKCLKVQQRLSNWNLFTSSLFFC